MKTMLIPVFCFFVSFANVLAQSKKDGFPTYKQIMPKTADMVDYGLPGIGDMITVNTSLFDKNIFDYPENSVIYYLNGRKTIDRDYVKKMVDLNSNKISSVSTDEIRKDGKRIVRIEYKNKSQKP